MHDPIYLQDEHRMLRDQLRRFIDEEVLPHGEMWERDGMVPRDIVRKMGELGFLGIRYPEAHGGAELDTIATMVLSEELGRSTFGVLQSQSWFTPTWHRRTWPTRVPKRRKPSIYPELSQANLSRRSA